jgi:hypothetical protein
MVNGNINSDLMGDEFTWFAKPENFGEGDDVGL